MNFINGMIVLLVYQLLGEVGVLLCKIPIPGPVLGMILLFLTLLLKDKIIFSTKKSFSSLENAATTLLSHLALLFIPAGVGMMVHFDLIVREWLPILIVLLFSTIMTLLVSALIMSISIHFFVNSQHLKMSKK
ncbi:MAG: CidA/LrgA family protein [gamma proteobacterium symbiont of Taylorina sp.]|nr:CidA/LrgA family protein [gamma proteobacterium symbiont of Taylorina sp.]